MMRICTLLYLKQFGKIFRDEDIFVQGAEHSFFQGAATDPASCAALLGGMSQNEYLARLNY